LKRVIFISALLLAGCTVGPDYHKQDIATPNSYSELPVTANQAPLSIPVANEADLSQWWFQFGDAELQKLIARALQSNLDLLAAASRVREAREQEIIAGAAGLPQINANGLATGVHSESNFLSKFESSSAVPTAGSSGGTSSSSGPLNANLFSAGFDATWEVDVFGGVRRSVEAAQANADAAVWQMRDGEVTLTAEIATDYLTLRATQEHIAILREETQAQQDLLHMIQARTASGFGTQLDVNQQSTLTDSTLAQIPELEGEVRTLEHAIAVLLAENPVAMAAELDSIVAIPPMPASLPVGLPSDLLRRRPDIRAAERALAAATAEIGVAVSDLYPKFDLIGAVSFAGGGIGNLVSGGNLGEAGVGSITWPVFHWGQTQANVHSKEEEAKQAYYAYQKSVLSAVQNVEDSLARYTTEQQRLLALERAEATAKFSVNIATQQFQVGTVTYVNVLTAQASELSVRGQLTQSRQVYAIDLISLYKALGGGWAADANSNLADTRENPGNVVTADPGPKPAAEGRPAPGLASDPDVAKSTPRSGDVMAPHPAVTANQIADSRFKIDPVRQGNIALYQSQPVFIPTSDTLSGPQLQLGAWRSEAAAMEGWNRATRQAGDLLDGLMPRIVAADVPGKGRYYRLRAAPVSRTDPLQLCKALVAKGLDCIVAQD
jgi:outer membrane protein, multidrug efflux system